MHEDDSASATVRPSYHHGNLRRALMDASLDLVAEKGVRGFSLAEAAKRAGVTRAAPYRHFADRESLVAAIAVEGFEALAATLSSVAVEDVSAGLLVEEFAAAYVEFSIQSSARFSVMFASDLDKLVHHEVLDSAQKATDILVAAAAGLATDTRSAEQIGNQLWAMAHGVATLAIHGLLVDDIPLGTPAGTVRVTVREWVAGLQALRPA